MKKSIVTLAFLALVSFSALTSCKNNEKKIEDAKEDVLEAKKDVVEAQKDSVADYEAYKMKINEKITNNELKIADLKVKVINGDTKAKARYNDRVLKLETKNQELKSKLNNYTEYKADTWEAFKTDLDKNAAELEKEFNDFNATK